MTCQLGVIEIASRKLSNSFSRSAKPVVIHTPTKVNKVIISTRMRVVPPQNREKSCRKRTNGSQGQSMRKYVHCIQMFMSLFQIQATAPPLDLFILKGGREKILTFPRKNVSP